MNACYVYLHSDSEPFQIRLPADDVVTRLENAPQSQFCALPGRWRDGVERSIYIKPSAVSSVAPNVTGDDDDD